LAGRRRRWLRMHFAREALRYPRGMTSGLLVTCELTQGPLIESANRSVLQRGTAMSGRGRPSAARRTNWWKSREYEVGCGHDRRPVRSRSTQGRFAMAAPPELDVT
jgi:hypothetical protein